MSSTKPRKNPKLLIVGYYGLADGFATCANFLRKNYDVTFFPLMLFHNEGRNVIDGFLDAAKDCDVVLLWYFRYFISSFTTLNKLIKIKKALPKSVKFIGYSWDHFPPNSHHDMMSIHFFHMLDHYITGNASEIDYLKNIAINHVSYSPAGFDSDVTKPMSSIIHQELSHYNCDVSIVCTNLYTMYPAEWTRLQRKPLLDALYLERDKICLHIYGPDFLKELYPDCYKGFIKYDDCPKVFTNSKINLCLHPSVDNSGNMLYYSERLPQILGSKGLLYCETIYNELIIPDTHYVLADPTNPVKQILQIISEYHTEKYQNIIENGYNLALNELTWDKMRKTVQSVV